MYAEIFLITIVSTAISRTGYCQLSEEVLQDVEFTWSEQWLSNAYVKICNYSSLEVAEKLQNRNIDIWHISSNTVELCTTISNDKLKKQYNLHCNVIIKLKDFILMEEVEDFSLISKQPRHIIHLRASNASSSKNKSNDDDLLSLHWFDKIHNFSVIRSWYKRLGDQYNDLVYINNSIGKTERGYDIFAIHISRGEKPSKKPKIYLQCLIHAREWISGPVCMYISLYLIKECHRKQVSKLLNQLEFILVPVANPDGYAATWFRYPLYRYWRKNLAAIKGSNCLGVDLNRNFDIDWGQSGTSSDPCNSIYGGPSAQSELEVQAITAYILANKPVYGAMDFHSYGQFVLYPHGWTTDQPIRYTRLSNIAMGVSERVQMINGSLYLAQTLSSLYLASGTFCDWAYKKEVALRNQNIHNISYRVVPLTLELRPKGTKRRGLSGFLVDPNDILPTCKEMIQAVKWFSKKLLKKPLKV